jgi:hypothetical protein
MNLFVCKGGFFWIIDKVSAAVLCLSVQFAGPEVLLKCILKLRLIGSG